MSPASAQWHRRHKIEDVMGYCAEILICLAVVDTRARQVGDRRTLEEAARVKVALGEVLAFLVKEWGAA